MWFRLMTRYEDVHPLEGGGLRLKFRRDRRLGLPIESPFVFYPRYIAETLVKLWRYWHYYRQCMASLKEVLAAPDRYSYTDIAIEKPDMQEFERLRLYHETRGGEEAVRRERRDDTNRAPRPLRRRAG
jgi:hypothetical protein